MKIQSVHSIAYSATGTTECAIRTLTDALSEFLRLPVEHYGFTSPQERESVQIFSAETLTVVGSPTYAGKLPNKILPDFQSKLIGNGTLAVPVVLFGNRSFDNALAELCAVLKGNGFHIVAAAALVGRHAFSDRLGTGRPNADDLRQIRVFASGIAGKIRAAADIPASVQVPGDPDAPYYVPKGLDGQPVNFLKAKPKTHSNICTQCGLCAQICPMGAIDAADAAHTPGICIKCQRCVRTCPVQAKFFDDPDFLSHVAMLEQTYSEPKENLFLL